jgi:hypothetical protein
LALALALTSCAFFRLDDFAQYSACRTLGCPDLHLTKLRSWAFRADGCGQVSYFRCNFHDGLRCCRRVPSEHDAVKVIALRSAFAEPLICMEDD